MFKAAVIGAGSTYTPELIEGFIERRGSLPFDDIALMDIDEKRLEIVGNLAKRQLAESGYKGGILMTRDLDRALDGASFVFAQVRVGKMAARIKDEKIPLKYNLLGQETTGAGGFMKALRTIPVIMGVASNMENLSADGAWLINFSNPSGIIAEAVLRHTGINMIGLCNGPIGMLKQITKTIGTGDFEYEYVGLNHLAWITSVKKRGEDENLVAALAGTSVAAMANIPTMGFDPALLRAVPYIPSSYLSYYYMHAEQVKKCVNAEKTRGEICLELEDSLFRQYADPNLKIKPPELEKRGGAMYSTAALSAADSIANDKRESHIVSAINRGALPFLDDGDVIEAQCELGRDGIIPKPVSVYNDYVKGLTQAVKAYEKLTVRASLEGSRDAALAALLAHPLIGDFTKAKPMLDEMLEANREYLPMFFS